MYYRTYLIVTNENKKEKKTEIKFKIEKFKSPEFARLFKPKKVTAPNVGIESKNEIFAESNLLNLNIRAAVIVIPDLLTPGINDNI